MNTLNMTGTAQPVSKIRTIAPGNNYTLAPNVQIIGGGCTTAPTATAGLNPAGAIALLTSGTGYTSVPVVAIGAPLAGGILATAEATISGGLVTAINVVEPGSNYDVSAAAVAPTCTITGGGGTGATCQVTLPAANTVGSITVNTPGVGCTSEPLVFLTNKPGVYGLGASAIALLNGSLVFTTKSMTEGFDPDYGRMDIRLGSTPSPLTPSVGSGMVVGVERYIDPPNEIIQVGETILWRITHLGVDSHALHFHLFDLQVVNRIDYTNAIKPPYFDELGWRETIRTNPMEDIIVAIKPQMMVLPFPLPQSNRPLDPSTPVNSTTNFFPIAPPVGVPAVAQLTNAMTNFGYEYVWHCHLLGHEENDMMRPMVLNLATVPTASSPAIAWDPTLGKYHVAIRRADNAIYIGTANVDGNLNFDFLRIPATTAVAPSIAWDPLHNKVILAVKGLNNTSLWLVSVNADGSALSAWTAFPTAGTTASPAIAWNDSTSRVQYAVLRAGNTIGLGSVAFDGTTFSGFVAPVSLAGTVGSAPAIAIVPSTSGVFPGKVQLAVKNNANNRIRVGNVNADGSAWSGWFSFTTGNTLYAPSVAWNSGTNKLDVVVAGPTGAPTLIYKNSALGDSSSIGAAWQVVTGAVSSALPPAAGIDPLLTPLIIVTDNGGSLTGYSTPGL
jgi:hypothetical protein